ncbi:MaoC family dehydratase [Streptomyces oceani]|uniref:Dehydratase n=1 Tax=Streptomyces oceani TaxID=1075402 RepID=A0A1E7KHL5_9ACTN|nr:MaoC family dehydratase [Streptomyces oceani]OEV03440.1 dehydratase [Streptomyces oceani]
MAAKIAFAETEVGTELPPQSFAATRATLVRYAGASGDFNPIHWNERFAREVGLENVIAHGMFTMAEAARVVTDWVGDPAAVVDYGVQFSRQVIVPDDDQGARIDVTAQVAAVVDEAARTVRVDLTAMSDGQKVLGRARAVVALA